MTETKERTERLILVSASGKIEDADASLDELEELVHTAGGESCGRMIQNLEHENSGTYLGKGKMLELKSMIEMTRADGIVCDDELSPAQLRNMEMILDTVILDRTMVILDIFAKRAKSREGKLQVEMAQLKYRAARLVGIRDSLSRLGGGIGTRGPGEKKLEIDRRLIHERIGQLKSELADVEKTRQVNRSRRMNGGMLKAAIVGYTNAGKSTLLNHLTGAGVMAEDKLFATLDPTTRVLSLDHGEEVLLTDTVGFIRKLPHSLIEAFRSTLEEAKYADVIIHVVDVSNPQMETQMHVVYETLRELKISDKTYITAFNKIDSLEEKVPLQDFKADYTVSISAKTGEGFTELKDVLMAISRGRRIYIDRVFPYSEASITGRIRKYGQLITEEYTNEGIHVEAYVNLDLAGELGLIKTSSEQFLN